MGEIVLRENRQDGAPYESEADLTMAQTCRIYAPQTGGDYVKGSIHWKKDRFAVAVYWHGKTEWFWRSTDGNPLFDKRQRTVIGNALENRGKVIDLAQRLHNEPK